MAMDQTDWHSGSLSQVCRSGFNRLCSQTQQFFGDCAWNSLGPSQLSERLVSKSVIVLKLWNEVPGIQKPSKHSEVKD